MHRMCAFRARNAGIVAVEVEGNGVGHCSLQVKKINAIHIYLVLLKMYIA